MGTSLSTRPPVVPSSWSKVPHLFFVSLYLILFVLPPSASFWECGPQSGPGDPTNSTCSSHGQCVPIFSTFRCACDLGYDHTSACSTPNPVIDHSECLITHCQGSSEFACLFGSYTESFCVCQTEDVTNPRCRERLRHEAFLLYDFAEFESSSSSSNRAHLNLTIEFDHLADFDRFRRLSDALSIDLSARPLVVPCSLFLRVDLDEEFLLLLNRNVYNAPVCSIIYPKDGKTMYGIRLVVYGHEEYPITSEMVLGLIGREVGIRWLSGPPGNTNHFEVVLALPGDDETEPETVIEDGVGAYTMELVVGFVVGTLSLCILFWVLLVILICCLLRWYRKPIEVVGPIEVVVDDREPENHGELEIIVGEDAVEIENEVNGEEEKGGEVGDAEEVEEGGTSDEEEEGERVIQIIGDGVGEEAEEEEEESEGGNIENVEEEEESEGEGVEEGEGKAAGGESSPLPAGDAVPTAILSTEIDLEMNTLFQDPDYQALFAKVQAEWERKAIIAIEASSPAAESESEDSEEGESDSSSEEDSSEEDDRMLSALLGGKRTEWASSDDAPPPVPMSGLGGDPLGDLNELCLDVPDELEEEEGEVDFQFGADDDLMMMCPEKAEVVMFEIPRPEGVEYDGVGHVEQLATGTLQKSGFHQSDPSELYLMDFGENIAQRMKAQGQESRRRKKKNTGDAVGEEDAAEDPKNALLSLIPPMDGKHRQTCQMTVGRIRVNPGEVRSRILKHELDHELLRRINQMINPPLRKNPGDGDRMSLDAFPAASLQAFAAIPETEIEKMPNWVQMLNALASIPHVKKRIGLWYWYTEDYERRLHDIAQQLTNFIKLADYLLKSGDFRRFVFKYCVSALMQKSSKQQVRAQFSFRVDQLDRLTQKTSAGLGGWTFLQIIIDVAFQRRDLKVFSWVPVVKDFGRRVTVQVSEVEKEVAEIVRQLRIAEGFAGGNRANPNAAEDPAAAAAQSADASPTTTADDVFRPKATEWKDRIVSDVRNLRRSLRRLKAVSCDLATLLGLEDVEEFQTKFFPHLHDFVVTLKSDLELEQKKKTESRNQRKKKKRKAKGKRKKRRRREE